MNLKAQLIKTLQGSQKALFPRQLLYADSAANKIHFRKLTALLSLNKPALKKSGITPCNTSTFNLQLTPAPGQKIELRELQTLPDGNFIMAANITLLNSELEGLLCLLENAGNVISQTQVRVNNKPVTLYDTKVYPDGTIVIAGIVHDATGQVFVSCLNPDLSVKWLEIFSVPSAPGKVTLNLVDDMSVALGVQLPDAIWYCYLDNDGSLKWQKQVAMPGLDALTGFGMVSNTDFSVVLNRTITGRKLSEIFTVAIANGNILSSYLIGNGISEYKYSHSRTFNGRMISTGIKRSTGGFELVRDINANAAQEEVEHTYTIPESIDFNTSSALDNSGSVMGFCFPQQGKLVFLRHFAYYQTSPENTREYDVPVGSSISSIAKSLVDGGYLLGLNTSDSNRIILIKTDSIGTLAGCGYKDITNSYEETINKPNTATTAAFSTGTVTLDPAVLNKNPSFISGQFVCNQNYCPAPPSEDTCLGTFYKTFRSSSYANTFNGSYLMQNDIHLVFTGKVENVLGHQNIVTSGVQLYNAKGDFIKGSDVYCDSSSSSPSSYQIDKQHVMLLNYTSQKGVPTYTFTLINDNLQILWTKTVNFNGYSFGNNTAGTLVADAEGNFYLVGSTLGFMEKPKVLVYKMDKNGNGLWFKYYEIEKGNFLLSSAVTTKTSLIIVSEGGPEGSVSVSIDKNTGEMHSAYLFQNSSAGEVYQRYLGLENDHIFYAGNNGNGNLVIGTFDTTGKPIKFKSFADQGSVPRAAISKAGMLYVLYSYYSGLTTKNVILKADTTLKIVYKNIYDVIKYGYPASMAVSDDGSIYAAGSFFYGGANGSYADGFLEKFDANGVLGTCGYQPGIDETMDINLNVQPISFNVINSNFVAAKVPVNLVPDGNGNVVSDILCSSTQLCSSVKLSGTANICDLKERYSYVAATNPGCTLLPTWTYDTSFVILKNTTADTATFVFKHSGATWIKTKLNTGCTIYLDSILVTVQAGTGLSIANDSLVCPDDSIKLNAPGGFSSYTWNNGSVDSFLVVKAPGLYFVNVKNGCGQSFADSAIVTQATVPSLVIDTPAGNLQRRYCIFECYTGIHQLSMEPHGLF